MVSAPKSSRVDSQSDGDSSVSESIGGLSHGSSRRDYRKYRGRQKLNTNIDSNSINSPSLSHHQRNTKNEENSNSLLLRPLDVPRSTSRSMGMVPPLSGLGPGRTIQQLKESPPATGRSWSTKDALSGRDDMTTFSIILEKSAMNNGGQDGSAIVAQTINTTTDQVKVGPGHVIYELKK